MSITQQKILLYKEYYPTKNITRGITQRKILPTRNFTQQKYDYTRNISRLSQLGVVLKNPRLLDINRYYTSTVIIHQLLLHIFSVYISIYRYISVYIPPSLLSIPRFFSHFSNIRERGANGVMNLPGRDVTRGWPRTGLFFFLPAGVP